MIVDTSAAVAILCGEPEADSFRKQIEEATVIRMSAGSVLELTMVIGRADPGLVNQFIDELGIEILPITLDHLRWARHAHLRFGRGSGSPAKLNYGDCLSYGAARATRESLLYKGNDFGHTDLAMP